MLFNIWDLDFSQPPFNNILMYISLSFFKASSVKKKLLQHSFKIHIKQRSKKIPTKLSVQSENILIPV